MTSSVDTYFLDPAIAFSVAARRNTVHLPDGSTDLQICYHDGTKWPNAPENMVCIPIYDFSSFFERHPEIRIPTVIQCPDSTPPAEREKVHEQFRETVASLQDLRALETTNRPVDTYFLSRNDALAAAKASNQVSTSHPTITGLQVCYYDGERISDAPRNCINVPAEQLAEFLSETRYRLPTRISLPNGSLLQAIYDYDVIFTQVLKTVHERRQSMAKLLAEAARKHRPNFVTGKPLTFWMPTSRLTTVLQYATKNIAKALRQLGHKVYVSIEKNDMQELDDVHLLGDYLEAKPDVVFFINRKRAPVFHDEIVHVSWWQDPAQEITQHKQARWSDRDLVYSISSELDDHLRACSAPHIIRQHFCIDESIFRLLPAVRRENKIVFAGTSYANRLIHAPAEHAVIAELVERLEQGHSFSKHFLQEVGRKHDVNFHHVFWDLYHYVVRDITLEWLCRESPIPVEIYGRGWDKNSTTAPFFKGEIEHGSELARLYNSAKYALVTHPFEVNSQRLAETAACGAIPVVFDCRSQENGPHWDEYCLFFKNPISLAKALTTSPEQAPEEIAKVFGYEQFAERLVDAIQELVFEENHML